MTTGLDPQARRDAWELIERVRDRGTTVLLVTHFMEEVERLCDRVALINAGRIVALDTPAGLAAQATRVRTVRFPPSYRSTKACYAPAGRHRDRARRPPHCRHRYRRTRHRRDRRPA